MFKGDTKSMAQSAEFQELMGNVELLEAFVSPHRTKGGKDEVKGKNLSSALQTWVEEALFTERGGAAVHIATIHRYKGDEADVMFIVNEMMVEDDEGEKPMSCFMSQRSCEASPESATNEISMGYVAFTRAKKQNIIINVDLQGEVCSDVEQRLQAAFDRDVEALTTSTVQEPQDTPESDSGATDEDTACSDDEDSGGKEDTDEQQPTLPKVLPSPVVIMKRDWSKVNKRTGERTGELTQKLHIDANLMSQRANPCVASDSRFTPPSTPPKANTWLASSQGAAGHPTPPINVSSTPPRLALHVATRLITATATMRDPARATRFSPMKRTTIASVALRSGRSNTAWAFSALWIASLTFNTASFINCRWSSLSSRASRRKNS